MARTNNSTVSATVSAIAISQIIHSMGRTNKLLDTDPKVKEAAEALKANIGAIGLISAIGLVPIATGDNAGKYLCADGNQRLWCLEALGKTELLPGQYRILDTVDNLHTQGVEASANYFRIPETKREYSERVKLAMSQGKTVADIARDWGMDIRTIETWAGINSLPEPIREKVVTGELTLTAVDQIAKAGKKLSEEEKIAILNTFTKDTTIEQAKAIRDSKVAEKKTANILATITGKTPAPASAPVEKKLVFSVSKAEEMLLSVKAMREAGRNDAPFLLVGMVIDYIYGVIADNPFKA